MPRTLSANYILKANELDKSYPWIVLIRADVGGGTFLNITNHPRPVIYQTITYNPYPIRQEVIEQTQQGKFPQLVVHVSNATREVQGYLEAQDGLRGKTVILRLVNLEDLAAGDISLTFVVDSVMADAKLASFVLKKTVPAHQLKLPGRTITRVDFPALPGA
jgi:phage-related protein